MFNAVITASISSEAFRLRLLAARGLSEPPQTLEFIDSPVGGVAGGQCNTGVGVHCQG